MKKLLLSMSALAALAAVAPASAQYSGSGSVDNYYYDRGAGVMTGAQFRSRIAQLEARLDAGIRQGVIDTREAQVLRSRLWELRRLERNYSYNGLTVAERRDLQNRLRDTRNELRFADNGRFDRDWRYGNWTDDGYIGRGGPLEADACINRGGLFDSIFGRPCLHVGDRATGNLYGVPLEYRNQYRDTQYSYFRTDGRLIYEIDSDTGQVIGSWDMRR